MAFQIVLTAQPVRIRREKGSTVTFINQNGGGGTDIFLSVDRSQLAASLAGTTPAGTKLGAGGTVLQYPNFPGEIWARAAADTNGLEILP